MTFTTVLQIALLIVICLNSWLVWFLYRQIALWQHLNNLLVGICTGAFNNRSMRPELLKMQLKAGTAQIVRLPDR